MEIEEVKKEIVCIFQKELANMDFSAFFFGSRVMGTNTATSDLDIGIEGKTKVPQNILRSIKAQCTAIPTLYSIDIIDFSLLNDEFKKIAKEKVEYFIKSGRLI